VGLCERGGTEETSPGEQPLSLKERRHFKDKGFSSMSEESWMCRLSPEIQLRGLMEMEMESGASRWGGGSRDWRASKCGWCWRKHPLSQKNALNRLLSLHPQGNGVCVCVCVCVCVREREREREVLNDWLDLKSSFRPQSSGYWIVWVCATAQSCPTLCKPMNCRAVVHQAPLSREFSRQEHWSE